MTPLTVSSTEGGAGDSYRVVLTGEPGAAVTATIIVTTDGQLRAEPPTLMFTVANWRTPQVVSVSAVDDATEEGAPQRGHRPPREQQRSILRRAEHRGGGGQHRRQRHAADPH